VNRWQDFAKDLRRGNPIFRLLLAFCPALAAATSAADALGLGLAATLVLTCSNRVISAIRSMAPSPRTLGPLLLLAALACREPRGEHSAELFAMGGIPVHVRAWDVTEPELAEVVATFRAEVQRLEAEMSLYRTGSALSRLNRAEGRPVVVAPETAEVIRAALAGAAWTDGAFDATVQPILKLWKEAEKAGAPPSPEALAAACAQVGSQHVAVMAPTSAGVPVRLAPGAMLDLGGVAKGYLADLGVKLLRRHGVRRGLVELGGDLAAFDDRPTPLPFRIGIRDPDLPDRLLGTLEAAGGGIVTSGDYERGFDVGGRRYNHIVDPRSGQPVRGVRSATVIAATGTAADIAATGVVVLGPDRGLALIRRLRGFEALIVASEGLHLRATPGFLWRPGTAPWRSGEIR
jgi:thiamine biosynthesis lipoprotein